MTVTVQDYINNANAIYQQIQQTHNTLVVTQLIIQYNYYIQQAQVLQLKNKKSLPHYKSIFIPPIILNNHMPKPMIAHATMKIKHVGFRHGTRKKRKYRRTRSYKNKI
jgi:hypothetical protein